MPTNLLSKENDFTSPFYLLGFNQDEFNASIEDSGSFDISISDESDESDEDTQVQSSKPTTTSSTEGFMKNLNRSNVEEKGEKQSTTTISTEEMMSSLLHSTNTIKCEKQTLYIIPETRSSNMVFSNGIQSFACEINCSQHISYNVISTLKYRQSDLEKLDIVLNENSVLDIQLNCTLNGLDVLDYSSWLTEALSKIMKQVEFANITPPRSQQQQQENQCYQFGVQKAFVTTPLSYLLEKQAPHGVLNKINIHLDFQITENSKDFVSNWKDKYEKDGYINYVEEALFEVLMRRVFHHYPLIFSSVIVKRLVPIISQLPHISHSLYKFMQTAKNTSPNQDFAKNMTEKVKMIEANTVIMRPHYSEVSECTTNENDDTSSVTTSLTLGMYHTLTNNIKQQQKKNDPLAKVTALGIRDSPDALEAIGRIWSITCSSAASTLTEEILL